MPPLLFSGWVCRPFRPRSGSSGVLVSAVDAVSSPSPASALWAPVPLPQPAQPCVAPVMVRCLGIRTRAPPPPLLRPSHLHTCLFSFGSPVSAASTVPAPPPLGPSSPGPDSSPCVPNPLPCNLCGYRRLFECVLGARLSCGPRHASLVSAPPRRPPDLGVFSRVSRSAGSVLVLGPPLCTRPPPACLHALSTASRVQRGAPGSQSLVFTGRLVPGSTLLRRPLPASLSTASAPGHVTSPPSAGRAPVARAAPLVAGDSASSSPHLGGVSTSAASVA